MFATGYRLRNGMKVSGGYQFFSVITIWTVAPLWGTPPYLRPAYFEMCDYYVLLLRSLTVRLSTVHLCTAVHVPPLCLTVEVRRAFRAKYFKHSHLFLRDKCENWYEQTTT